MTTIYQLLLILLSVALWPLHAVGVVAGVLWNSFTAGMERGNNLLALLIMKANGW